MAIRAHASLPARLALAGLLLACQAPPTSPPTTTCDGVVVEAASAQDRHLLGIASRYPADTTLESRYGELVASQRARRQAAWEAVARVLAPVTLTEPTPLGETTVPRFRTFYDSEDFRRIFQDLYGGLTPDERAMRARFTTARVDDAFDANAAFIDTLGTWTPERWAAYVASFTTSAAVASIGGVRRLSLDPAMTRHLVESYPEVLDCLANGAPPASVAGEPRTDRLMRTELALDACGSQHFGPFFVARDGTLDAALEGASDPQARVAILEGSSFEAAETYCEDASRCSVDGPGAFYVRVTTEGAVTATLDLSRTETAPPVACLDGALPLDAVSIAAEWRRLQADRPLPTYDTSADRLRALIAQPTPTWGMGEGQAMPGPSEIYTQQLPTGEVFVLAGFHVRTRELPLGLDITVWWSDRPDEDFGADRPASITALGGPWSHYKMCVAIEHTELDPEAGGGLEADAPSLAAALHAVSEGRGGPTWCSNPYIDGAPGLARGNCVGCHQHAMSGLRPGEIATDGVRFPSSGRLAARNNYPADGYWGLDAGDGLAGMMQEVVDYWR